LGVAQNQIREQHESVGCIQFQRRWTTTPFGGCNTLPEDPQKVIYHESNSGGRPHLLQEQISTACHGSGPTSVNERLAIHLGLEGKHVGKVNCGTGSTAQNNRQRLLDSVMAEAR